MLPKTYKIELLDKDRNPLAQVQNLIPIDTKGNVLQYSQKLSDYGLCRFRIATHDPFWKVNGDIAQPFANHVRITRKGQMVWQGPIVKNPERNRKYIEVEAYEYEYLMRKAQIRHDASDGQGAENYRNLKSGSMQGIIQTFLNEAKADYAGILGNMVQGTVENPPFPANFTDINNANIGGQPWNFSDNFSIKFDYRDLFYVIQQLSIYALCDFEIDKNFTFNFKKRIGADKPELVFEYSKYGMISDYDAPRDGEGMANSITGIAADTQFNILKADVSDATSITKYGKLSDIVAYSDVKNVNLLRSRLTEELALISTPDAEIRATLNQNAYPFGQYSIGDTITLKVKDGPIDTNTLRRIVTIDMLVHNTGTEKPRLITNKPRNT